MLEPIHDRARGKWRSILPELGIDSKALTGKHGPCPICGGKDRFRFTDQEGRGAFYCNGCGAGSGVDLVMRKHGVTFVDAVRMIEPLLPSASVYIPKTNPKAMPDGRAIWSRGQLLRHGDIASRYLESRGIRLDSFPSQLRLMERALYVYEPGRTSHMPAMIANFVSPDRSSTTVHFTFLDEHGRKAEVPKVRKFYPGKVPEGGAIRLAPSADTMGVAEGIETALSAMQKFGIPVWATTGTPELVKWQPPETARNIIVFGDSDESFGGQHAAYALAYRLRTQLKLNVEVRIPPGELGCDWNDVLQGEAIQ